MWVCCSMKVRQSWLMMTLRRPLSMLHFITLAETKEVKRWWKHLYISLHLLHLLQRGMPPRVCQSLSQVDMLGLPCPHHGLSISQEQNPFCLPGVDSQGAGLQRDIKSCVQYFWWGPYCSPVVRTISGQKAVTAHAEWQTDAEIFCQNI